MSCMMTEKQVFENLLRKWGRKKKKSSGPVGQKHHYDVMPGNTIGMQ